MINYFNARINLLIIFLMLLQIGITAQTIEWSKSYGGSRDDYGYNINKTTDNGFIIIGDSKSTNGDLTGNNGPINTRDMWVVKIDSTGNLEWQKNYGGSDNESGRSIVQTFDGGYIFTGATLSNDGDVNNNHGENDTWVVKITTIGNIEWEKTLGGSGWDFGESLIQTSDSAFIVLGISRSSPSSSLEYIVYKLNSNGDTEWQKKYGGSEDEYSTTIIQTTDLGFIISGRSKSDDDDVSGNHGEYDCCILKLNQNGEIEWEKNYGGSENERANDIELPRSKLTGNHTNSHRLE